MNKTQTLDKTDREAFAEWLGNCPVDFEFQDRIENDDDCYTDFYFFIISKEDDSE